MLTVRSIVHGNSSDSVRNVHPVSHLLGSIESGNAHTAHTTFPPSSGTRYQFHSSLSASTSTKPRPPSASIFASLGIGAFGFASHAITITRLLSDSSQNCTGGTGSIASGSVTRAALTALVIISDTSSSTVSASSDITGEVA